MIKTLLSVLALFTFALCNAQVKTQSNYDVDGNGKVTIEDVTGIYELHILLFAMSGLQLIPNTK